MWLNVIGWTATAVFSSSYFFKEAATLRRIQAVAAFPVGAIRSGDPIGAGSRRQPHRQHRCIYTSLRLSWKRRVGTNP